MKILIVEDEFVSRTLLQEIFSPYGVCHAASNGLECLAAFQKGLDENKRYDLICLDIMMPEMDGQQALKKIREIEQERGIGGKDLVKVIMVSALGDAKNIMKSFMKGQCEAYLTKPIDSEKVIATCVKLGLISE
ncbi:MAG TPA: response regulator [Deltaproteobacteria bacterium]|nr:response regulator [Deltaproteobacteria bacterium]